MFYFQILSHDMLITSQLINASISRPTTIKSAQDASAFLYSRKPLVANSIWSGLLGPYFLLDRDFAQVFTNKL